MERIHLTRKLNKLEKQYNDSLTQIFIQGDLLGMIREEQDSIVTISQKPRGGTGEIIGKQQHRS